MIARIRDQNGLLFFLGDKVARAKRDAWGAPEMTICSVTRITDDKIYLDDSHISIRYPRRLAIVLRPGVGRINPDDNCVDVRGLSFRMNDSVARLVDDRNGLRVKTCTVTKIENSRVYLDHSHVPIHFPERLAIINS